MKTNHPPWPIWTKTLTALWRLSPALATRFQQEAAHATKLTLQPAAEYFWEGTGQDFAEWRDFPPLRLPAAAVWGEWTMPAGCRVGSVYEHAAVRQRLTGPTAEQGVLLLQRPRNWVQVDCFAPARLDGLFVASFLYLLPAGRVVEQLAPGGGYFAPRVLAPGLVRQAEASGVDPASVLSAIEITRQKQQFQQQGTTSAPQPAPMSMGDFIKMLQL